MTESARGRPWPWLASWGWAAALTLSWLGLAGQWDLAEAVAALLFGTGAAVVGVGLRLRAQVDDRPTRLWWRHGPGMVAQACSDSVTLIGALLRRPRERSGVTRAIPCDVGGPDGEAAGRRVLTTWGTSLQPDSYVIRFDEDEQAVVVHQLVSTDQSPVAAELLGRRPAWHRPGHGAGGS